MTNWMSSKAFACLSLLLFLLFLPLSPVRADQMLILNIIANSLDQGEFFVIISRQGDFIIRIEDLKQMGLKDPRGTVYEIEDELYIALSTMRGVGFAYDELKLALEITALPFHFGEAVIDFQPPPPKNVIFPIDSSAFLNYSLNYANNDSSDQEVDLFTQLGGRYKNFLFLSDSTYMNKSDTNEFVRLMTNVTYDQRSDLRRLIVGDYFAFSGSLGSTLNLGGISLQKLYSMEPQFIQHPTVIEYGSAAFPSKLDIYLDGVLIKQIEVAPGDFELENVTARTGAGLLEIVLTDPFGKEERLVYPFYQDSRLLKTGLHEYSYNTGFLREDFGEESFKYGDLVLSGFHRYGLNDAVTLGGDAELSQESRNIGASSVYLVPNVGVITTLISASHDEDGQFGSSGAVGYRYETRNFNTRLEVRAFTKNYSSITLRDLDNARRHEWSARLGYNIRNLGSVNAAYSMIDHYSGDDTKVVTLGYSKNLIRNVTFFTRFQWTKEAEDTREIAFLLSYSAGHQTSLTASYQNADGTNTESIQIRKNPNLGEGLSGRALFERESSVDALDTFLQYDAKFGTYTGQYRNVEGDQAYEASASGSIAYAGNTVGITRPIRDGFAVVEVGDVEGVRVYRNNQEIGRTNSEGKVFLPDMISFYNNQISIADQDIPIGYMIPEVFKVISPPLRSGSYIKFNTEKFHAVAGTLGVRIDGDVRPVELTEIQMVVDEREMSFSTGRGGDFYIENLQPGIYSASFEFMEKPCQFDIMIPAFDEIIIDLGELICEPAP